jgi:energy-converting hydrogenase Eha subunit G
MGLLRSPNVIVEVVVSYVLIVVGWLGGAVNGAAVTTQEVTSAERCEAARLALVEDAKARGFEDALRPICLQK